MVLEPHAGTAMGLVDELVIAPPMSRVRQLSGTFLPVSRCCWALPQNPTAPPRSRLEIEADPVRPHPAPADARARIHRSPWESSELLTGRREGHSPPACASHRSRWHHQPSPPPRNRGAWSPNRTPRPRCQPAARVVPGSAGARPRGSPWPHRYRTAPGKGSPADLRHPCRPVQGGRRRYHRPAAYPVAPSGSAPADPSSPGTAGAPVIAVEGEGGLALPVVPVEIAAQAGCQPPLPILTACQPGQLAPSRSSRGPDLRPPALAIPHQSPFHIMLGNALAGGIAPEQRRLLGGGCIATRGS